MSGLDKILHVDVWTQLHPVTKLVIKILQHVRDKLNDIAEIRASLTDDEILITSYKSEIRISKQLIEFKRRGIDIIRVQRAKINIPDEVYKTIKQEIQNILEHSTEPSYSFIVETLEKHLRRSECHTTC